MRQLARRAFQLARRSRARVRMALGVPPLSDNFTYERGQPLLRYYMEKFLEEFSGDIRGHCLEFQEPTYTQRHANPEITRIDILHIDDSNPNATLVADLTRPNDLPDNLFDCILCTFVVHLIFDLQRAISEMRRLLKPGGVLLIGSPHVSMCDPGWVEYWRFTSEGMGMLLAETFGSDNVTIRAYGNSLTAAGSMRGMSAEDFTRAELDVHQPRFCVLACGRAQKTSA